MLHHVFPDGDKNQWSSGLLSYGALLAVEIGPPKPLVDLLTSENKIIPPPKTGYGLIDTGATFTTVHEQFITDMGVNTVGTEKMSTPSGGVEEHNSYPIRFKVPSHNVDVELPAIITANLENFKTHEGESIICLIGRDFLTNCVLIYNGELGMYTLAT